MTTKPREQASPVLIVGSMAFDDLELPTGSEKDVVGGSATYAAYTAGLFAPVQFDAIRDAGQYSPRAAARSPGAGQEAPLGSRRHHEFLDRRRAQGARRSALEDRSIDHQRRGAAPARRGPQHQTRGPKSNRHGPQ